MSIYTRPWGYYQIIHEEDLYHVKKLRVESNQRLSYQRHRFRSEHWFIVLGSAIVTIDGEKNILYAGESIDIPAGVKHRIESYGDPVEFIEVQTGTYFGEDDIERLEDDYGRN